MKPWRCVAAFVLVAAPAIPGISRIARSYHSDTRAVTLDGQRFAGTGIRESDADLAGREYTGSRGAAPPALPAGLRPEHTLRMERASGPLTLAFGGLDRPCTTILRCLQEAGWYVPPLDPSEKTASLATITTGKETRVVLLDEKGRQFLFLHRMEE